MPKVLAMYLPQFHEIEENNLWWGKGHTEWVSVKRATPLFRNHKQPFVPLGQRYYSLLDAETQVWQSDLAQKYGVYGFVYYHYWFEGKLLLQAPAENMLANTAVTIPFCFSWANHTWVNSVLGRQNKGSVLIEQTYGDQTDWEKHFYYLLPFFKDSRYIRVDGKPMIIIYNASDIACWSKMRELWDRLASVNGINGLHYVTTLNKQEDVQWAISNNFDAQFQYMPRFALRHNGNWYGRWFRYKSILFNKYLKKRAIFSYRIAQEIALSYVPDARIINYYGIFAKWDTTPRWGNSGFLFKGASAKLFEAYLRKVFDKANATKESDFVFITAWNEWSEGAYLEPDTYDKYSYLEAIHRVVGDTN